MFNERYALGFAGEGCCASGTVVVTIIVVAVVFVRAGGGGKKLLFVRRPSEDEHVVSVETGIGIRKRLQHTLPFPGMYPCSVVLWAVVVVVVVGRFDCVLGGLTWWVGKWTSVETALTKSGPSGKGHLKPHFEKLRL